MPTSSVMGNFLAWFDRGGGEIVDTAIKNEYSYLLNISGVYMPLHNGWWILSIARLVLYIFILAYIGILIIITIIMTEKDLNTAAQLCHYFALIVLAIIILICLFCHRRNFNGYAHILANNFYDYKYLEDTNEIEIWKKETRKTKLKIIIAIPIYLSVVGSLIIGGSTLDTYLGYTKTIENDEIDTRLPVEIWHPHSKESIISFIMYSLGEIILSGTVVTIIAAADILIIFKCMAIVLQFKILHKSIASIDKRARFQKQTLSLDENTKVSIQDCYKFCIQENIEHHIACINGFKYIEIVSSIPTGVSLFFGSIVIALSLLAAILGESTPSVYFTSFLLLFGEIANMAVICYYGQQISDHGLKTMSVLYATKWRHYPKELTLSMRIIMEVTKRPLVLMGCGITPLNYATFSSVINSSYSYLNLLLAAKAERGLN